MKVEVGWGVPLEIPGVVGVECGIPAEEELGLV